MVFMIHPALSLHTYTIYHQSLTWGKLLSSVNGLTDTWIHLLESYTLGLPRSEAWKTKLKNTIVFASNIYLLEYSFRCFLLPTALGCFMSLTLAIAHARVSQVSFRVRQQLVHTEGELTDLHNNRVIGLH